MRSATLHLLVLAGVSLLSTLNARAQQCNPAAEDIRSEITQTWQGHVQGHYDFDAERASELYAEKMNWRSKNGIAHESRQAWAAEYAAWYDELKARDSRILDLQYITESVMQCGEVFLEHGYWTMKSGPENAPRSIAYSHSILWMRSDGGELRIQGGFVWERTK